MAVQFGPLFAEVPFAIACGPAWSHPALTARDCSIAITTTPAARGVSGSLAGDGGKKAQGGLFGEGGAAAVGVVVVGNDGGGPRSASAVAWPAGAAAWRALGVAALVFGEIDPELRLSALSFGCEQLPAVPPSHHGHSRDSSPTALEDRA
jgi:hypothetical protein